MQTSLSRTGKDIAEIYNRHKNTIYRVCFAYMKNAPDTEDAVQDTFSNLIRSGMAFQSEEHEKAWLIRTASNVCKNAVKHWWHKCEPLDIHGELSTHDVYHVDETLQAVLDLPDMYKTAVYLYYYEGYNSTEIANILEKPQSTIRYYLMEARKQLRNVLQ